MWFVITQLYFVWGSCLIYVYLYICIYFIPLVSKAISMSDDVGFVKTLTRRVTVMEQELLTLPEHLSFYLGLHCSMSMCMWCIVIRCLSFFVWPLHCFALLRFVAYANSFGIFRRFFLELHSFRTLQFKPF